MTNKKTYPSQQQDRYIVRFPDGMRDQLAQEAKANNRSMNSEIIARLEASLRPDSAFESAQDVQSAQKLEESLELAAESLAKASTAIRNKMDELVALKKQFEERGMWDDETSGPKSL